jgi:DNA (cytosine-5)-methyltransferase 1
LGVFHYERKKIMDLFNSGKKPLKIDKPIRLIELFSGIGAQAKALERLGADFEHHRTSEWEVSAVASYKAIHKYEDDTDYSKPYSNEELLDILCNLGISTDGKKPMTRVQISRKNEQWKRTVYNNFKATNNIGSIMNISGADLGIVDTDKYCYIMTYSFPCQDLSLAGKQKGMAKGSGTRSGLLWEVERLLNECDELPQILLMENVTQVHGTKNKEHFQEWIDFLESKGYSNYWQDLNAKNYGIPQNRNRTFMVSVLGDYTYEFPEGFPLQLRLKHLLEDCVDEKYYISDKGIEYIVKRDGKYTQICDANTEIAKSAITAVGNQNWTGNFINESVVNGDVSKTVRAGGRGSVDRHSWDLVAEPKCEVVGMLSGGKWDKLHDISRRVHSGDGVAPTIHTSGGGQQEPKVVEPAINKVDIPQIVRVRKYTVDCESLCKTLRSHRAETRLSNQQIAEKLDVPITKVEHWFRQDNSFAIPDADIWLNLKAMLGIMTEAFDDAIMTFEEREGVFEKSNRCYLPDGLAPTITSASADEKIVEPAINVVGNYSPSGHDASRIVDTDGLAPTVKENHGTVTAITEPFIAASRGRNPDNPSDRTPGAPTEQRLEPNFSGCSNTLTTVQKDNYVVEPRVIGGIGEKKSNGGTQWYQQDRIYDNEIAISVTTSFLPYYKTEESLAYDEQNGYIRKDGTVGTLTTDGSSPKHNNRVIVPEATKKGYAEAVEGDSINLEHPNSKTRRGRVGHGVAQTLTTTPQQAVVEQVRIRKLTPKECWRLMGFDDADFEKAAQFNSNSHLYKQAGNSITVDVLYYIFEGMM